jgi:hypothetical protein
LNEGDSSLRSELQGNQGINGEEAAAHKETLHKE